MASGHVNRANRPNTWLHRPATRREDFSLPTRSRPHMAHRNKSQSPEFTVLMQSGHLWTSGLGRTCSE